MPGMDRIMQGNETEPHEYPWTVYMNIDGKLCGGSIISDSAILTAAHCVFNATEIEVVAGAHHKIIPELGHQTRMASAVIIHEEFNPENLYNDIAIVSLADDPLSLNNKIAAIPLMAKEPSPGEMVTIAGWGRQSSLDFTDSEYLRSVDMPVISDLTASLDYLLDDVDFIQVMCLDISSGAGSCTGDDGGPVFAMGDSGEMELTGLLSFGPDPCTFLNKADCAASVPYYLGWILAHMP